MEQVPKTEIAKPTNMGEFMELVKSKGKEAKSWIEYWLSLTNDDDPEDAQEQFDNHPVTEEMVLNVSTDLRAVIRERINGTISDELIISRTAEGHKVLRQFHSVMENAGFNVDIDLIDQHLRPTEMMMDYKASEEIARTN